MSDSEGPRLAFRHIEEEQWFEVKAQMHGDKRVSVWEKYLEWTPERLCLYARYDPGMVIEKHSNMSDHVVYVLEGEITIGDKLCTKGMHVTLEKGAQFGPIIGGTIRAGQVSSFCCLSLNMDMPSSSSVFLSIFRSDRACSAARRSAMSS